MKGFDIHNPLSGLKGEPNGATNMIMQREQDVENVIKMLVTYYRQGYDINNDELQEEIFDLCGLYNPTVIELSYIQKMVARTLYAEN